MRRSIVVVMALVVAALTAVAAGQGRATADDLSVKVHFVRGSTLTKTTALANDIQFDIFTDGPAQTVTMRFSLPAGLSFGGDVPDPSENCTNGATVVCTIALTQNNDLQAGWIWPIIAAAPGTYTITATVEGERPDALPADNSTTFTFEVKPAVVVAVSAPKSSPPRPKAGSPVTFRSTVRVDGVPTQPSKVTCAATLGGAKARGVPRASAGLASCRYATKRADKGKRLAGSIKVTVAGKATTKRFAATLG